MLLGVTVGVVFSRNDWKRHPLAKILTKYGHDWRAMASLINAEFRDIDKFISGMCETDCVQERFVNRNPESLCTGSEVI